MNSAWDDRFSWTTILLAVLIIGVFTNLISLLKGFIFFDIGLIWSFWFYSYIKDCDIKVITKFFVVFSILVGLLVLFILQDLTLAGKVAFYWMLVWQFAFVPIVIFFTIGHQERRNIQSQKTISNSKS